MVIPCAAAAAKAAGAASSAGATALGLSMGKSDLDLTRDLFKMQMRQTKRLWTADYAENSLRHSEAIYQNYTMHVQSQLLALAQYYQSEKHHIQAYKQAYQQDLRNYEMNWRNEVRENLRDELQNQNNRFNIIMLCDTVCLSCVFSMVTDGVIEINNGSNTKNNDIMIFLYVLLVGISILLFTLSLWCSVIVVRRLYEHTASTLEHRLFLNSVEIQNEWNYQIKQQNIIPTSYNMMNLVNVAYEKWIIDYIEPLGKMSIHMLSVGVVTMFITAGLLTHNSYMMVVVETTTDDGMTISSSIQSTSTRPHNAVYAFWFTVIITCSTVLYMKYIEDRNERRKIGIYDVGTNNSHHKTSSTSTPAMGPYAKISRAGDELCNDESTQHILNMNNNPRRMELLNKHSQRGISSITSSLKKATTTTSSSKHDRKKKKKNATNQLQDTNNHSLQHIIELESKQRSKTRQEIMKLLTTAAEELDALPEELTSTLNKIIHDIDDADKRCATTQLAMQSTRDNDEHTNGGMYDSEDDDYDTFDNDDDMTLATNGGFLSTVGSTKNWNQLPRGRGGVGRTRRRRPSLSSTTTTLRSQQRLIPTLPPMSTYPIDAQRIPITCGIKEIRKKLGEISVTTLLRIKNTSDEALRLKSGLQLKSGYYIQSMKVTTSSNTAGSGRGGRRRQSSASSNSYQLYPVSEIPPRSEVVIAARCNRGALIILPHQFLIQGEIVYVNKSDESNTFTITFQNGVMMTNRYCNVDISRNQTSTPVVDDETVPDDDMTNATSQDTALASWWDISKQEIDLKSNNEVVITIGVKRGMEAMLAWNDYYNQQQQMMTGYYNDNVIIKEDYVFVNKQLGLRLQWEERYMILSSSNITFYPSSTTTTTSSTRSNSNSSSSSTTNNNTPIVIQLQDITQVQTCTVDLVRKNVFEIQHTVVVVPGTNDNNNNKEDIVKYKISASSSADRDEWIQAILQQRSILLVQSGGIEKTLGDDNDLFLRSTSNSSSSNEDQGYQDNIECDVFGTVL